MQHVEDVKRLGCKVIFGGAALRNSNGYFIQPTLVRDMSPELITTREVFATVLGIYPLETEEEVISLANKSDVGLGSFIMTENMSRCVQVAEALKLAWLGLMWACSVRVKVHLEASRIASTGVREALK